MHVLTMLGGISLTSADEREVDGLLRQPKALALLAFLAMPRPGTWHRRDLLLAAFWPELDQQRARAALRTSLYAIRRHLTSGALRSRGDDEVGVDPEIVTTDVARMLDAHTEGRHEDVLKHYRGDLLPALYVQDAEGFEHWLDQERVRLKAVARKSAALAAESRERIGDVAGAVDAARIGAQLDPDDEAAARRWIALLDRAGDRVQALAVFERFRDHALAEFGVQPSAETLSLVSAIRERNTVATVLPGIVAHPSRSSSADAGAQLLQLTAPAATRPVAGPLQIPQGRPLRQPILWALAISTVFAVGLLLITRRANTAVVAATRRLVVLPPENETGDASQDYIAIGLVDGVARRLEAMGGFTIRSGARSEWPAAVRHDYRAIAAKFGTTVLLRTTLGRIGDSLEIRASVIDAASLAEKPISSRRFTTSQLAAVEGDLAASIVGAVFRVPIPATPRREGGTLNPESHRLDLEGWHQLLGSSRNLPAAMALFTASTKADPSNARAWSGLSSSWAAMTMQDFVPFDVGYDRASAAASRALELDSLQGTALANLGILQALRYDDLSLGEELIRKASVAEPSNPEIFLVKGGLYRHAWMWNEARDAIRVAQELDPLSPRYVERELFLLLCANRPGDALPLFDVAARLDPTDSVLHAEVTRTLARLQRYDDAITWWRTQPGLKEASPVAIALATARGADGYWTARHLEGRVRLAAMEAKAAKTWVSPRWITRARFQAGDTARAFAELELAAKQRNQLPHAVPCLPELDEVRDSPHFRAILTAVGPLRPR